MTERRTIGLTAFIKGSANPYNRMPGCANYDHHYGGCLLGDVCKVQQKQRCDYFERAVLPTAEDIGLKDQLYADYEKQTGSAVMQTTGGKETRLCPDCCEPLRKRQRVCEKCRTKRRRISYHKAKRKKTG